MDCKELLELFISAGVHPNKRLSLSHASHQEELLLGERMRRSTSAVCSHNIASTNRGMHHSEKDELLRKLEDAVANSITIVVACVFEDKLPSHQDPEVEASQASPGIQSVQCWMRSVAQLSCAWEHTHQCIACNAGHGDAALAFCPLVLAYTWHQPQPYNHKGLLQQLTIFSMKRHVS